MNYITLSSAFTEKPILIFKDKIIAIKQNPSGDCIVYTATIEDFEVRESLQTIEHMLED